jgi:D-tyrosyl-tRNA(Tyr) deacylase
MRAVVSRVAWARVEVDGRAVGEIGPGLLALVAVHRDDGPEQAEAMAQRLVRLRLFGGEDGRLAYSALDLGRPVLLVSQFTLYGDTRRGLRPSFDAAASAEQARPLFERLVAAVRATGLAVATGQFGAYMQVHQQGDGPVTVIVDVDR